MPTAIQGCFTNYKLYPSRAVTQIIIEVDIKQTDRALAALGGTPQPEESRWVEISPVTAGAAIAQQADTNLGSAVSGRNTSGSPVAPRSWSELPPSARAALLCKKAEFQHWCGAENEDVAAIKVRQRCGVESRSQIDGDPAAHQIFCKIEQDFLRRNEPPPHDGSR